jgi:hypothetical protein
MITVAELIERLEELPPYWQVQATRSGRSLAVWNEDSADYGYVFTDEQDTKLLTRQA